MGHLLATQVSTQLRVISLQSPLIMALIVRFLVILHLLALVLARLSLARLFIGDFFRPKNFDISKNILIEFVHFL